jgi:hypothetical protein
LFSFPSIPFSSFLFPFPNLCSLLNPSSYSSLPASSTPPPPFLTCTMYPSVCACMYPSVICKSMPLLYQFPLSLGGRGLYQSLHSAHPAVRLWIPHPPDPAAGSYILAQKGEFRGARLYFGRGGAIL